MLVELKTQNCMSYKDMTRFSMVGVDAYKEQEQENVLKTSHGRKVLKSTFVFGGNASGKSNLIEVFGHMKRLLAESYKNALDTRRPSEPPVPIKFRLHERSQQAPTMMEATLVVGTALYRYGFEIDGATVVKEWLYQTMDEEIALFTREGDRISLHRTRFKDMAGLKDQAMPHVLFLAQAARAGGRIAGTVFRWFHQLGIVNAMQEHCYQAFTMDLLERDPNFQAWATKFLAYLGIVRLSVAPEEESPGHREVGANLSPLLRETIRAYVSTNPHRKVVLAWYNRYGDDGRVVGEVASDFVESESSGTRRLLYLLGPIYDTLRNGKVLLIDELESQMHPLLLHRIVELFHAYNRRGAQFVVITHGTELLSRGGLRRDQVWFVEKAPSGASRLYSLTDFGPGEVGNGSNLGKNYLAGKYGAIPVFM